MITTKPNDYNYLVDGLHVGGLAKLKTYPETPDNELTIKGKKPFKAGSGDEFPEVKLKARLQNNLNKIQSIQNERFNKKLEFLQEKLQVKKENDKIMRLMNLQKNYLMEGMVDELLDKMRLSEQKRLNQLNKGLLESNEDINNIIKERKQLNLEQFKEKPFVEREKIVEVEKEKIVEVEKPVIVEKEKIIEKPVMIKDPEEAREIGVLQERLRTSDLERQKLEEEIKEISEKQAVTETEKTEKENKIKELQEKIKQSLMKRQELRGEMKGEIKGLTAELSTMEGQFIASEEKRQALEDAIEDEKERIRIQQEKERKLKEVRKDLNTVKRNIITKLNNLIEDMPLQGKILEDFKNYQKLEAIPVREFRDIDKIKDNELLRTDYKGNKKFMLNTVEVNKSIDNAKKIGINVEKEEDDMDFRKRKISNKQKLSIKLDVIQRLKNKYNDYVKSLGLTTDELLDAYALQTDIYKDLKTQLSDTKALKSLDNNFYAITLDEANSKIENPYFDLIVREFQEEGGARR